MKRFIIPIIIIILLSSICHAEYIDVPGGEFTVTIDDEGGNNNNNNGNNNNNNNNDNNDPPSSSSGSTGGIIPGWVFGSDNETVAEPEPEPEPVVEEVPKPKPKPKPVEQPKVTAPVSEPEPQQEEEKSYWWIWLIVALIPFSLLFLLIVWLIKKFKDWLDDKKDNVPDTIPPLQEPRQVVQLNQYVSQEDKEIYDFINEVNQEDGLYRN